MERIIGSEVQALRLSPKILAINMVNTLESLVWDFAKQIYDYP